MKRNECIALIDNTIGIIMAGGRLTIIDSADYLKIAPHHWCPRDNRHTCYAFTTYPKTTKGISMHRLIVDAVKGCIVDHRDGNGLMNRRNNLRSGNTALNRVNARKTPDCFSKYKGVTEAGVRFMAAITHNGKRIYLGTFDKEIEAALAYNTRAIELWGEFARLNDLPPAV